MPITITRTIRGASSNYPAWRQGKSVGSLYTIAGTANMADDGSLPAYSAGSGAINRYKGIEVISSWGGPAFDVKRGFAICAASGGDHALGHNWAAKLNLMVDAPLWTKLADGTWPMPYSPDGSTPGDGRTPAPANALYPDGRPRGFQQYFTAFVDSVRDAYIAFNQPAPFGNVSGPGDKPRAFYLDVNEWDGVGAAAARGPFPNTNLIASGNRICAAFGQNAVTGDVYMTSNTSFMNVWQNDGTATGTFHENSVSAPGAPFAGLAWSGCGIVVDTFRNQLRYYEKGSSAPRVERMSIASPYAPTYVDYNDVTGTGASTLAAEIDQSSIYGYHAAFYDPYGDQDLILTGDSAVSINRSSHLWSINPTTRVINGSISTPQPLNGINCRAAILQPLKALVWIPNYGDDIQFVPLGN